MQDSRREHDVPCASLQVLAERVNDLERWQKEQNGTLKELKQMLGDSIIERKGQYADLRHELLDTRKEAVDSSNRSQEKMDRLVLWMLAAVTGAAVSAGLLVANLLSKP